MSTKSAAIVVSAGRGARYGGLKQLEPFGGRRVVDISLAVAAKSVQYVVCVKVPGIDFGDLEADAVTDGGATRSDSVRAGLLMLPRDIEFVLIHDAARPLATAALYKRILARLQEGSEAVIPVVGIADTVKEIIHNEVVATLDRSRLYRVQTPQGFRRSVLELAYQSDGTATDDSQLVEELGVTVDAVPGEQNNFKITTIADLERAKELLERDAIS